MSPLMVDKVRIARRRRALAYFGIAFACPFTASLILFKTSFNPPLLSGLLLLLAVGFLLAFDRAWSALSREARTEGQPWE